MNIHTKNGKRTIKLDATERRQLKATRDLMAELAKYCQLAKGASTALGIIDGQIKDATYNPVSSDVSPADQSNQSKDSLGEAGKVEKGSANGAGSAVPVPDPTARTTPKG